MTRSAASAGARFGAELVVGTLVIVLAATRGSLAAAGLGIDVAVLALLAIGLQVTFGLCGQLNLAQAPIGALGGYVVGALMVDAGWSFWWALPLALLASSALAVLVGLPCLRVRGDVLALVTLGAGEVLVSGYLNTTPFFGGYDGISAIPQVTVAGSMLSTTALFVLGVGLTLVAVLVVGALARSPLGRSWRAVRDDETAAASLGIAVGPVRLGAFAVGGAVAGVAGALYAVQESFISSTAFELTRTVNVVLVVLLAGGGRLRRTILAAGTLTVLSDRLSGYAAVSEAVTGVLVLLIVAQRLGGLESMMRTVRDGLRRMRFALLRVSL